MALDRDKNREEWDYAQACADEQRFVANGFMRKAKDGQGFSAQDRAALAAARDRRAAKKVRRLSERST